MDNKQESLKEKFDTVFAEWVKVTQEPKIRLSSRPQDYIDNDPYREMVRLGKGALPFIMEKLEKGVFFLNQAVVDVTGMRMEEIIGEEMRFPSEQEKSALIMKWWKTQEK